MAFKELKDNVEQIQQETKAYLESSVAYYKLWGFKVAMKSTSVIVKFLMIVLCLAMVLSFISIVAAIAIGYVLDNLTYGFLIVGSVYVFFSVIVFLLRDKLIEGQVMAKFQKSFLTIKL